MPDTPENLAGDLVEAVEALGEVFDARGIQYASLRMSWAAVPLAASP